MENWEGSVGQRLTGVEGLGAFRAQGLFHLLLKLFKGPDLDLAYPLAADVVLDREVFERDRIIAQPPRLQDVALARREFLKRGREQRPPLLELFGFRKPGFLVQRVVGGPVTP